MPLYFSCGRVDLVFLNLPVNYALKFCPHYIAKKFILLDIFDLGLCCWWCVF